MPDVQNINNQHTSAHISALDDDSPYLILVGGGDMIFTVGTVAAWTGTISLMIRFRRDEAWSEFVSVTADTIQKVEAVSDCHVKVQGTQAMTGTALAEIKAEKTRVR